MRKTFNIKQFKNGKVRIIQKESSKLYKSGNLGNLGKSKRISISKSHAQADGRKKDKETPFKDNTPKIRNNIPKINPDESKVVT